MASLDIIRHGPRDGPRDGADGIGILFLDALLETLVLGRVEVGRELVGHGDELILHHTPLVVVVEARYHQAFAYEVSMQVATCTYSLRQTLTSQTRALAVEALMEPQELLCGHYPGLMMMRGRCQI